MKEIPVFLTSALRISEEIKFTTKDTNAVYAFEFILILIGEKLNAITEELKGYCQGNPKALEQLGKFVLLPNKIPLPEEQAFDNYFRVIFYQTPLGKFFMVFNQLRNQFNHNPHEITLEDHQIIGDAIGELSAVYKNISVLEKIFTETVSDDTKWINFLKTKSEDIVATPKLQVFMDRFKSIEKTKKEKRKEKKKAIKETGVTEQQFNAQRKKIENITQNLWSELNNLISISNCDINEKIILYAVCMSIIYLGAHADILVNTKLKQIDVSEADKNIIRKHEKNLRYLYDTRSGLAHLKTGLPSKTIIKNTLHKIALLKDGLQEIYQEIEPNILPNLKSDILETQPTKKLHESKKKAHKKEIISSDEENESEENFEEFIDLPEQETELLETEITKDTSEFIEEFSKSKKMLKRIKQNQSATMEDIEQKKQQGFEKLSRLKKQLDSPIEIKLSQENISFEERLDMLSKEKIEKFPKKKKHDSSEEKKSSVQYSFFPQKTEFSKHHQKKPKLLVQTKQSDVKEEKKEELQTSGSYKTSKQAVLATKPTYFKFDDEGNPIKQTIKQNKP